MTQVFFYVLCFLSFGFTLISVCGHLQNASVNSLILKSRNEACCIAKREVMGDIPFVMLH